MKNDQKLPVISKNNINIPESCRIETIRKYIKEQLGNEDKENFKLRNEINSYKPLMCGFYIKKQDEVSFML